MYIAILGRQAAISMAELERLHGADSTRWFSSESALVENENFDFERLGGSQKAGKVIAELSGGSWKTVSTKIVQHYEQVWSEIDHKITLGISAYGFRENVKDIQATGIILKKKLRASGISLRLIPNADNAHNTAVSHHNKLGLSANKVELLVVRASSGKVVIAESVGAQNITAIAARDQARPKRDAFVGMLPPKLARIMVNLGTADLPTDSTVLDAFCGTGVILQEAGLIGYKIYGTDLSHKMIDYSNVNLEWLNTKIAKSKILYDLEAGDAKDFRWQKPFDALVSETYLGQPFSAPPSRAKLIEVRGNCDFILTKFLENLASQVSSGTTVCLAIPAWNDGSDKFTHLDIINRFESLGFNRINFSHVENNQLLYYRSGQVVARQLIIIQKS